MKTLLSSVIALAIIIAMPGMAHAKGNHGGPGGKVTAVDTTANTITVEKKKTGESTTFKAAGATVTVDGQPGKLSDITVGMHVKITTGATPDVAASIKARTHKKGGKKHGGSVPASSPAPTTSGTSTPSN
ncbi:MAG: hypothetical protein WCD79_11160 [Chthoniobacteraceae bacterium]